MCSMMSTQFREFGCYAGIINWVSRMWPIRVGFPSLILCCLIFSFLQMLHGSKMGSWIEEFCQWRMSWWEPNSKIEEHQWTMSWEITLNTLYYHKSQTCPATSQVSMWSFNEVRRFALFAYIHPFAKLDPSFLLVSLTKQPLERSLFLRCNYPQKV